MSTLNVLFPFRTDLGAGCAATALLTGGLFASMPFMVGASPGITWSEPRIGIDGDHVYVLWQEIVFSGGSHGGEAFFARSTDGGESFSEPVNLSETADGVGKGRLTENHWHNGSHDLIIGPDGTVHVVWTAFEGALHYTRSEDGGETFAEPTRVAGDGELPARGPSLRRES